MHRRRRAAASGDRSPSDGLETPLSSAGVSMAQTLKSRAMLAEGGYGEEQSRRCVARRDATCSISAAA